MHIIETLLIAISVSLDAFAISVAGALTSCQCNRRNALLAALFFGGFQFLMPLLGYFIAIPLGCVTASFDHWIAFGLLFFVGVKMIVEGCGQSKDQKENSPGKDFFSCRQLIIPAIATSLDALAVGAGIALTSGKILIPALAMGVVTAIVCAIGVWFGSRISHIAKTGIMSVCGGCIIILIGLNILRQHLC